MKTLALTALLALSITACSTTHFAALSDDLVERLDRCERPRQLPPEWLTCAEDAEACRRAIEAPLHVENAQRHHRCADLIDDVRREAETAKLR